MTTSTDLTNRALAQIGSRSQVTSLTDGSTEAIYANLLYNELRDFMLREGDYDWAATVVNAIAAAVPPFPWVFAYTYPAIALRVRNLIPSTNVPLDPQPIEWNVIQLVSGTRSILTKTAISLILITYAPPEDTWDSIFTEAFVRLLGSCLAFAIQNRIEASKMKLQEALSFAGLANLRDA